MSALAAITECTKGRRPTTRSPSTVRSPKGTVVIRQSSPSSARRSTKPVMHETRPSILSDMEPVVSKTRQMSTSGRPAKLTRVPGWRLRVEPSDNLSVGVRPERRAGPPPDTLGVSGVRSTSTSRLEDPSAAGSPSRRHHRTPSEPAARTPVLSATVHGLGRGAPPERARHRVSRLFKCCACCVRSALFRHAAESSASGGGRRLGVCVRHGSPPPLPPEAWKAYDLHGGSAGDQRDLLEALCRSAPRQRVQGVVTHRGAHAGTRIAPDLGACPGSGRVPSV